MAARATIYWRSWFHHRVIVKKLVTKPHFAITFWCSTRMWVRWNQPTNRSYMMFSVYFLRTYEKCVCIYICVCNTMILDYRIIYSFLVFYANKNGPLFNMIISLIGCAHLDHEMPKIWTVTIDHVYCTNLSDDQKKFSWVTKPIICGWHPTYYDIVAWHTQRPFAAHRLLSWSDTCLVSILLIVSWSVTRIVVKIAGKPIPSYCDRN